MIKNRFCFKCDKEIKPIHIKDNMIGGFEPDKAMWLDGIVDKIAAGYGSDLDGDMYIIAICDNCIKASKNIEYVGDYLFGKKMK